MIAGEEGVGIVPLIPLMAVLVMAAGYFTCVHLGREATLRVLTQHVHEVAQRILGLAEFRFYAIADGIKNSLFGPSHPFPPPEPPPQSPNLSLFPLGP